MIKQVWEQMTIALQILRNRHLVVMTLCFTKALPNKTKGCAVKLLMSQHRRHGINKIILCFHPDMNR
jgi:hypothetical protein